MDIQRLWPLTLGPYEFKIQAQLSPWIESQLKLFLAMAENYKVTINPKSSIPIPNQGHRPLRSPSVGLSLIPP